LIRRAEEKKIKRCKTRTGFSLGFLLARAGIPQSYYLTPEEEKAAAAYDIENPLKGRRALCYEMIDKNIVFAGCTSVYRRLWANMEGLNAGILVTETKELYPEAEGVQLISGNGDQFISKDFKELLELLEIKQPFTPAGRL
jgi:hypothetical protein